LYDHMTLTLPLFSLKLCNYSGHPKLKPQT
jgi:hypothetical protein